MRNSGFTILELLIVVIIVGIVASFAIPRFSDAVKRAKIAEAKIILSAIRSSQIRYYDQYGVWHLDDDLSDGSALDILVDESSYYNYYALDETGRLSPWGNPHVGCGRTKVSYLATLFIDSEGNFYYE